MKKLSLLLILSCLVVLAGCRFSPSSQAETAPLTKLNIIDRNGMSETISSKDRLSAFQKTDFLNPQPYQKVLRVYGRDENGDVSSCITSYHPNGQVKQYLEAINNRAYGMYREWYPSGKLRVESCVIGGIADLNTQAEESWLFDGANKAWNEEGNLLADILYEKGDLVGEAHYFHDNGQLWKSVPHKKNLIDGTLKIFREDGSIFQTADYQSGLKHGLSMRYWNDDAIAFKEFYKEGRLLEGEYYDLSQEKVSEICEGKGFRALFGKETLQELQEYLNGYPEGIVKVFGENRTIVRTYGIRDREKDGEEIDYYISKANPFPKMLLTWSHGILQGPAKTWYENGNLQSQKEISQNKKNGLSTAWYKNGALMLVEEYANDCLVKGEYYRLGEKDPITKVDKGKGIATLFDSDGNLLNKIPYQDGKPQESFVQS